MDDETRGAVPRHGGPMFERSIYCSHRIPSGVKTKSKHAMKATRLIKPLLPVVLLSLAIIVLYREAQSIRPSDVKASINQLSAPSLIAAVALTALNYTQLTLYDIFGLRYINQRIAHHRAMFTSFIAIAFGHNLGFSLLSGGSIRFRMYSTWGVSIGDISKLIAFTALTFWVGFLGLGGLAFLFASPDPHLLPRPLSGTLLRVLGAVFLTIVTVYFVLSARIREEFLIKGLRVGFPSPQLASGQLFVGSMEWLLAASVLFILLPAGSVSYLSLLVLFLLAVVVGLISQIPGGLGVFESIMLAALSPKVPAATVIGVLVLFRIVYYLCPLLVAVLLLTSSEIIRRSLRPVARMRRSRALTKVPEQP